MNGFIRSIHIETNYVTLEKWLAYSSGDFRHCDLGVINFALPGYVCQACGNGVVELDEDCDDGDLNSGDGCSSCEVEVGYECNDEPSDCDQVYVCGDGVITIDP